MGKRSQELMTGKTYEERVALARKLDPRTIADRISTLQRSINRDMMKRFRGGAKLGRIWTKIKKKSSS